MIVMSIEYFCIIYNQLPWEMIKEKMKFEFVEKLLREHQYKPLKIIGSGSFGEVFLIENAEGKYFAAKAISKLSLKKKTYLQKYINQEIEIMFKLNHPNLVRNYICLKSNFFLILINEYCNGGNVLKYQSKLNRKIVPLEEALLIICDILKGLKYMHDLNFIHRDIKAENILIENDPNTGRKIFKIADFGFARSIDGSTAKTLCGTEKYMAPQVLVREPYGESSDVWSLGVLLYFMLFSEFPFRGYDIKAEIKKRCTPEFTLNTYSKSFYKNVPLEPFFQSIFIIEKQKRMKISEIPYHPLFKDHMQMLIKQMKLEEESEELSRLQEKPQNRKDEQKQKKKQKNGEQEQEEQEQEQEENNPNPHRHHEKKQQQSQSQIQPQDPTNSLFTLKQKIPQSQKHLQGELQEIKFQVEKIEYLKESARCIFEMYKDYFNYTERIAARYYFLKVFLIYAKPLLENLEKLEMPGTMKELEIENKKWIACTLSPEYGKIVDKLRYMVIDVESNYEDTFFYASRIQKQITIKNFQANFKQDIQSTFDEVKLSYRSVTAYFFSKIRTSDVIDPALKIKMQMRIFCCHAINRIFKRKDVTDNFPYFVTWLKTNKINYSYTLDLVFFKKWILSDDAEALRHNLKILIEKHF